MEEPILYKSCLNYFFGKHKIVENKVENKVEKVEEPNGFWIKNDKEWVFYDLSFRNI